MPQAQYEYHIIRRNGNGQWLNEYDHVIPNLLDYLNYLGKDGWKLVGTTQNEQILMREQQT